MSTWRSRATTSPPASPRRWRHRAKSARRRPEAEVEAVRNDPSPAGDASAAPEPRARAADGRISLSFDDGPDPEWTPQILAALARSEVHATFFVSTGPFRGPEWRMAAEIAAAGHEVGFHCEEHVRHGERTRPEVAAGARRGLDELASIGVTPRLWRTPWGRVAPWSDGLARDLGLELCNWSDDTHDWRGDSAAEMLERLRSSLSPGSIVLMHDGLGPGARRGGCAETLALIPGLVELARERASEVAPVGPLGG